MGNWLEEFAVARAEEAAATASAAAATEEAATEEAAWAAALALADLRLATKVRRTAPGHNPNREEVARALLALASAKEEARRLLASSSSEEDAIHAVGVVRYAEAALRYAEAGYASHLPKWGWQIQ